MSLAQVQKRVIPVERAIAKEGSKYVITLPVALNPLWQMLKERGAKLKVYIEIPET